ncbi:unnamed protein product, partial [Adineta ricciae]
AQELALKISQIPTVQDRTINDQYPLLIEVNHDGTDLLSPRVCKLHPNTTYIGRDTKAAIGKNYLYLDGSMIDRDHCTIENQNGICRLIPRGEVSINGKPIPTSHTLQHGVLICFGRNSIFRYVDLQTVQRMRRSRIENPMTSSIYSSAPALSTKMNVQERRTSPAKANNSQTKIDVLPGLLDVPTQTEVRFLHAVFADYPLANIHFRLFPAYTMYMALRYRLSPYGNANIPFIQKQKDVRSLLYRIEDMFNKKIEESQHHGDYLAYWFANITEFTSFLKQDRDLTKLSADIQIHLVSFTQRLFYYFLNLLHSVLDKHLYALINTQDNLEQSSSISRSATLDDLLKLLSSLLDLLHKCRLNASLTIQIFSQIFLYINTWLFNRIIGTPELKLCSSAWGERFSMRLKSISTWAQRQGLEFPFECHLMKVNQLCSLLKSSKCDVNDVQQLLLNNPWKINSLQVKYVLHHYVSDENELPISNDFGQALIAAAQKYADESIHRQGLVVQLAEETDVDVPVILPEDGYTFESLNGIPQQLFQFVESINQSILCRLFFNPHSRGMWTEFMSLPKNENRDHDRIETIVLNKKSNNLGLTVVSASNDYHPYQGIYIRGIIPNGAAEKDGRLQVGDQILTVDQTNLINMTHEKAVEILKQCGDSVTLKILKDAANRHGLSALLDATPEKHNELARFPSPLTSSIVFNQPAPTRNSLQLSTIPSPNPYTVESPSKLSSSKSSHNQQNSIAPISFIRSANRTQSFMTRSASATRPVTRQDIPPDPNANYQLRSMAHPNTLVKQTNLINGTDVVNQPSAFIRKQQEPTKLFNTYRANLNEIRRKRIDKLLAKAHRTEHEDKELNNLQIEEEFDRRVNDFYSQTNNPENSLLLSNNYDEELRRRLQQFEHGREAERADLNRLLAKREARFHKDRVVSNIQEYDLPPESNSARMCEEDRRIEQTSLPKYLLRFE